MRRCLLVSVHLILPHLILLQFLVSLPASADSLDPLYGRIAADLKVGRPLVVTVHVALCDNGIIHCGSRARGDGDNLAKNLYWGAAAGFRAYFDRAPGYRRVALDNGDGKIVLQRVVYRRRVRPSARWRQLGVSKPFDLFIVGLGYRGRKIAEAMKGLLDDVAGAGHERFTITVKGGQRITYGSAGHLVGYAGHNHLMDVFDFDYPRLTRTEPIGYFVLACLSANYLAKRLDRHEPLHALLLTRTLMYPGAFTIDGIARAVAAGATHREVFLGGVAYYARFQKRPKRAIQRAFTYGGDPRWKRMVK